MCKLAKYSKLPTEPLYGRNLQVHRHQHKIVDVHLMVKYEAHHFACCISVARLQCTLSVLAITSLRTITQNLKNKEHISVT
jgi:hypothetical protein